MRQSKLTAEIKACAKAIADELPERLLKGDKVRHKSRRRISRTRQREVIEQSYNELDGEWRDWLEVARRYEHKVPAQDRYDIRHAILIELARARARDRKPIPLLRAYRIASLTVALYWREFIKPLVEVCVLNGIPQKPDYIRCSFRHKPSKCRQCPFLALRPVQSLDSELDDGEGNTVALKDTVVDDKAIDLDLWLDAKTFRLGCPMRLIQIARKRRDGIPLNEVDRRYFNRQRQKELKRHQLTLL